MVAMVQQLCNKGVRIFLLRSPNYYCQINGMGHCPLSQVGAAAHPIEFCHQMWEESSPGTLAGRVSMLCCAQLCQFVGCSVGTQANDSTAVSSQTAVGSSSDSFDYTCTVLGLMLMGHPVDPLRLVYVFLSFPLCWRGELLQMVAPGHRILHHTHHWIRC